MKIPARWFKDPVSVRTCVGASSFGPIVADEGVDLLANVSQGGKLTRSSQGDSDVWATVFRFRPADYAAVTINSVITFDGKPAAVTQIRTYRHNGALVYFEATTT